MKLTLILIAITVLFFVFLIVKNLLTKFKDLCALCGAVSLTWIGLLVLLKLNRIQDTTIIALLMGQSTIGLFYLLQAKGKGKNRIMNLLSLPIYLVLTTGGLALLALPEDIKRTLIFLLAVWIIFGGLLMYQTNPYINRITKSIIACCKRW